MQKVPMTDRRMPSHCSRHTYFVIKVIGHMMSVNKPIIPRNPCYFLTFNVIDRMDVFVRPVYKETIVNALNHFTDNKGLIIYAWCLMTSHIHLLVKTREGNGPAYFERDFKKYTTPEIIKAMEMEMDLRKEWMMQRFEDFGKSLKKIEKYHLWQSCSSPLHIDTGAGALLLDKIDHIHENPIREKIVDLPENYMFSSARDYAGMKGLVKVKIIQPQSLARIRTLSSN